MNKLRKIFLVSIFIGALSSPLFFAHAQDNPAPDLGASTPKISPPIDFPTLSVHLPGLSFDKAVCTSTECSNNWLAEYIEALYQYGIGIIGILAVITMMIGGILWLTAAGNDQRITDAKKWVGGSLMGVLIALTSYVILNMVNPALTVLSPLKIDYLKNIDLPHMLSLSDTVANNVTSGSIQSQGENCYFSTFGNSDNEVQKNLVPITLFGKKLRVHKLAKEAFEKVDQEVKGKTNYNFYSIGGQVWRANVNNPTKISTHAFGITVDINPDENPNYKSSAKPCKSDIPAVVVNAFKKNGFRWGGDYRTRCDAMHFEWLELCKK